MTVKVIVPPTEVVTLEEARRQIVELPREDEDFVKALIQAATAHLDGPDGWLGRALGGQTLEMSGWFGERCIRLPYAPIIDVVEIVTESDDGTEVVVDPATYRLRDDHLIVSHGAAWVTRNRHSIRYRAGYASVDTNDANKLINALPSPIKVAILMLVAQWYGTREPIVIGQTVAVLPFAVDALLTPFRVYS